MTGHTLATRSLEGGEIWAFAGSGDVVN
jgi:hypothetical protein